MQKNRREFLEQALIAAGALGAGLGAAHFARKYSKPFRPPNPLEPVLTTTGKLMQVEAPALAAATTAHAHQHVPPSPDPKAVRVGVPGRKWVMVIDLAKCDGCANCTIECNKMHHTPPDRAWIRVFKMQDGHSTAPYWFPKPCFQCDNPPCTKVCPVGATFKRQDGVVLIDNERCIGCRFCMAACPYSTRFFNWGRPQNSVAADYSPEKGYPRRVGTVEKCDFCPDMAQAGKLPGCVTACTMGALYYGDQNEDAVTNADGETLRLSQLLEDRAGYRYLAELGTEPRVYYLPPKHREYPKPALPEKGGPHEHQHHPATA